MALPVKTLMGINTKNTKKGIPFANESTSDIYTTSTSRKTYLNNPAAIPNPIMA